MSTETREDQRWAGADKKVGEYQRPHKKVIARRVHPSGTGWEKGIYKLYGATPEHANVVEDKFLRRVDQDASDALDLLLGDGTVPPGKRTGWSRFLMSMLHRHPDRLVEIGQNAKTTFFGDVSEAVQAEWEKRRQPHHPATFAEAVQTLSPEEVEKFGSRALPRFSDMPRVGQLINDMTWKVHEVDPGAGLLLTSDNPVIMSNGLQKPEGFVMMPISPMHLFVATNSPQGPAFFGQQIVSGEMNEKINHIVTTKARRFVYGVDDSQLEFVEARLGAVPKDD